MLQFSNILKNVAFLIAGLLLGASAMAQNLVSNPGFESGTGGAFDGWTIQQWYYSAPVPAHGGTHAASTGCDTGAPCISSTVDGAYFYQDIATTPGHTYNVSFWYRDYNSSDSPVELMALFGPTNMTVGTPGTCTGSCIFDTQAAVGVWTQVTATVTASSSTTRLMFLGRNDPASVFVDDVSVVDNNANTSPNTVPTLNEWAQLALGGLMAAVGALYLQRRNRA